MGLGSLFKKAVGLATGFAAGPLAPVASFAFDRITAKRDQGRQWNRELSASNSSIQRKVADARAAGINPYFAIASSGGSATPSLSPVRTGVAAQNAFDKVAQILEGREAEKDRRDKIQDELTRVERDQKRTGSVRTQFGDTPLDEVQRPTPLKPTGEIDTSIDDGGTGTTLTPVQRVVTQSGDTVDLTVGPEIDELLTGAAIETGVRIRNAHEKRKAVNNKLTNDLDTIYPKGTDVPWTPQLGPIPRGWGRMSRGARLATLKRAQKRKLK